MVIGGGGVRGGAVGCGGGWGGGGGRAYGVVLFASFGALRVVIGVWFTLCWGGIGSGW